MKTRVTRFPPDQKLKILQTANEWRPYGYESA